MVFCKISLCYDVVLDVCSDISDVEMNYCSQQSSKRKNDQTEENSNKKKCMHGIGKRPAFKAKIKYNTRLDNKQCDQPNNSESHINYSHKQKNDDPIMLQPKVKNQSRTTKPGIECKTKKEVHNTQTFDDDMSTTSFKFDNQKNATANISKFHKSMKYRIYQCKVCQEAWPSKTKQKLPGSYICLRCSRDKETPDFLKSPYAEDHVPNWEIKLQQVLDNVEQPKTELCDDPTMDKEEWMILSDFHNSNINFDSDIVKQSSFDWHLDSVQYTDQQIGEMPNWIKLKKRKL